MASINDINMKFVAGQTYHFEDLKSFTELALSEYSTDQY
uniref:Uncharacterized protein n=1 Tax=Arundo donax TaxID=35708 RepID=A0A0A9BSH9_ARUDO